MAETFSYEQDVAPQTTRFFDELRRNGPRDSSMARELSTNLFREVQDIRAIRQRNALMPGQRISQALDIESQRASLDRARRSAALDDQLGQLGQQADDVALQILDDPELLPEEKSAALQRAHFEAMRRVPAQAGSAGAWLSRKFQSAVRAADPRSQQDFTPSQIARFVADGGDPAIVETGDPVQIGRAMSEVAAAKQRRTEETANQKAEASTRRRSVEAFRSALSSVSNIDFAVDDLTQQVDETRFRGGDIVPLKIRRALSLAPDPKVRALADQAGNDPKKLRAALEEAYRLDGRLEDGAAPESAARKILPPRP